MIEKYMHFRKYKPNGVTSGIQITNRMRNWKMESGL